MPFRLNLGCGPFPIHQQHLDIMGDLSEWTLVDKYVKDPRITNWDALVLDEVEDFSVDTIYASHLLEHFPHIQTLKIISLWRRKLKLGGELILNVPDLVWACKQIIKYDKKDLLEGYYNTFEGEHGLQSVIYGSQSHEGEFHKAGFTCWSLFKLLELAGFKVLVVNEEFDAHDMGVLISRSRK